MSHLVEDAVTLRRRRRHAQTRKRLCQPESPDFILDLSDYYAFYTYTMLRGRVAV